MTVALLGIGADTTNAAPTPPVFPDGTFEYIPIPEARGPDGTTESQTYGTTPLRHGDGTLADYLDTITPRPGDGPTLTGADLANWPLHYDPNFEALTYGETTSRPAYTAILRRLEPGDVVAFYTGLQAPDGDRRHRYVIGYFTVAEIVDCQALDSGGSPASFTDLSTADRESLLAEHPDNAHVKRFQATGEIHDGDGLVIVDGREPASLLDEAVRISERHDSGHYYLTDDFQDRFRPEPGGNPDRNAHLGGVKTAHVLDVEPDAFRAIVEGLPEASGRSV
jgi:hypothetical protein